MKLADLSCVLSKAILLCKDISQTDNLHARRVFFKQIFNSLAHHFVRKSGLDTTFIFLCLFFGNDNSWFQFNVEINIHMYKRRLYESTIVYSIHIKYCVLLKQMSLKETKSNNCAYLFCSPSRLKCQILSLLLDLFRR